MAESTSNDVSLVAESTSNDVSSIRESTSGDTDVKNYQSSSGNESGSVLGAQIVPAETFGDSMDDTEVDNILQSIDLYQISKSSNVMHAPVFYFSGAVVIHNHYYNN